MRSLAAIEMHGGVKIRPATVAGMRRVNRFAVHVALCGRDSPAAVTAPFTV